MSDDTVAAKVKELQRLYPDYVNSNGTIEYELLLLNLTSTLIAAFAQFQRDTILQNSNILSYLDAMYTDIDSTIIPVLQSIDTNTGRIP